MELSTGRPGLDPTQSDIFNSASADLILRSSDVVDFPVHRSLLAIASGVFEGMCSLPQPPTSDEKQGLPLVQVGEDSHTLDTLLHLLYPDKYPKDLPMPTLYSVIKAAEKYDMHGVVTQLRDLLRQPRYLDSHSFEIFALACQYSLGSDLVQLAAKATLLHPSPLKRFERLPPEAGGLSAVAYHSLMVYRHKCISILQPMLVHWPHSQIIFAKPVWHTCICRLKSNAGKYPTLPEWYANHVERTVAAFSEVVAASTLRSPSLLAATLYQLPPLTLSTLPTPSAKKKPPSSCDCSAAAPYELVKFHVVVADEVERQLNQVRASICWINPSDTPLDEVQNARMI